MHPDLPQPDLEPPVTPKEHWFIFGFIAGMITMVIIQLAVGKV